jgi:multidrug efflux pump subunit AcrA (membrane-fusion protein)
MNTRQTLSTAALVIAALVAGFWVRGLVSEAPPGEVHVAETRSGEAGPCPGGAVPLYWKAPMDPTYVRDAPGKSPMGMDLVPECPSTGEPEEGVIRISSATVQNMGVRTAVAETRDLSRTIRALGRVSYDERRVAHAHLKIRGWVEKLYVDFVGQEVRHGDPLLEIYSPELVATQEELLLAARYKDVTAKSPFDDVHAGGRALFEATKRRMQLWDVPERDIQRLLRSGEITKNLTLYSHTSGVVTELGVRAGMEVGPNMNLYTIADLSELWVLADVYEYELPWIELGQKGTVTLSYLPGETFTGTVTYISPFLDPKTRTAEVRLEIPNPEGALKPGMFGDILIEGTPQRGATVVPSEAVIRSGQRSIAIVALGNGRFEPREVELGLDSGSGWQQILAGVSPGEKIVVSGQFLIDSESRLQEAVQKLLGTVPEQPEPPEPVKPEHDEPMQNVEGH